MTAEDLVRPSRDGDQFHYHWAARQCLELLPGATDLVSVTVEGPSAKEAEGDEIDAAEELIDVGLYFGTEGRQDARLVRYVQLKHSTRRAGVPWTASGLGKTIKGFAKRYAELLERFSVEDVAQRFRFEFTTNRPIDSKVTEAIADAASGAVPRHPELHRTFVEFTGLGDSGASQFFKLFSAEGGEANLWAQRNLLTHDVSAYLPDADYDAPIQLKELVTRKATTEFELDPSIRRHDVLRALKSTEEQLQPAPCLIPNASGTLPREQEQDILQAILTAECPVVIHADAGVGKSVLAARLTASMPPGSEAVLYDCFGDGLYRNALHFRHRHRDALVQIANELAARGLCHPLIPTAHADTKQYMRAFLHRAAQAASLLLARDSNAQLCLIIDAADNAEIAAEEQHEPASFVRDLIRAPLPKGVRLAFTCRTHRRHRLGAPPDAQDISLAPFSDAESARHLRTVYASATHDEAAEFAFLSSSNPRLQALALSRRLTLQVMLKQLGPTPTTVERAIGELLESAVARLRDQWGITEATHIEAICQALAVLRPLVPISVIAQLSQISESAVRSFTLDFGRPLLLKGDSLHFLDEPTETWFRERFQPDATSVAGFVERLRPLATKSSYVAAALPQILLQAGKLEELVALALSGEGLPIENPLAKRDVELQRLTFALKACLQERRYEAAAKLALKAGGESAGEHRQNSLIQRNTDLAALLVDPDRIEDIVSRRTFGSGWMGSHHAYDAALLAGRAEFSAEASSRLRMAFDWLNAWSRLPEEKRREEKVTDEDRAELAMALLRLRGPSAAARFLRSWTWRRHAFEAGKQLARRLIDLGDFEPLNSVAEAAGNDVWLLLGLASESRAVAHSLPAAPVARLLRILGDRRVRLPESNEWNSRWTILCAVASAIELAHRVLPPRPEAWAAILRRYLPPVPPSEFTNRFGFDRIPLMRSYALEAALRGQELTLLDVAPPDVRKQLEANTQYGRSQDAEILVHEVGGLLPWSVLSAATICGRAPTDLSAAIKKAVEESSSADSRNYWHQGSLLQAAACEWLEVLCHAGPRQDQDVDAFKSWLADQKTPLYPSTLIRLCRSAARVKGLESVGLDCSVAAYRALEQSREEAESRTDSYVRLARAILVVSPADARTYFDRAVEIASRIGDENLNRWAALLQLAQASASHERPRPQTAYRLSRVAELTYEYVVRDKHFDWEGTVNALTDLCGSSTLAILSRWRDRRFGDPWRLIPTVVYRLMDQGRLPAVTPIALAGLEASWHRLADLKRILGEQTDRSHRAADIAYRYMRVQPQISETLIQVRELSVKYGLHCPDADRLVAQSQNLPSQPTKSPPTPVAYDGRERRRPNWDDIFNAVDLLNADSLRAAYATVRTFDPPYELEAFFHQAFARVKVGLEPDLVRAIQAWPDFGIFELRYVLDAVPAGFADRVSLRNAVRDAVLSACRREPRRVQRRGWGALIPFEKLDSEGIASDESVVRATLEGFTTQVDTLDAGELFLLVHTLAACVSADEADAALNFGLDLLEEVLKPEDGDGPWRSELQPPESLLGALGGYVWAGLGSAVVAERWQFAHVVRSIVELGWTELLEALIACANNAATSPFVDRGLEFYLWHAREWLLIGLSRGGLENPQALRPAVPLLQLSLREEHVLIRAFAADSLRTLATNDYVALDPGELDAVNRSELPEEIHTDWIAPAFEDTPNPEQIETDDEKYYFGIDITPYWFAPLGRAFGLTERAIERRVKDALGKKMGWNGGGWRDDARHTRRIFAEGDTFHSHGSMPKADDLSTYHGYHGMMLAAAALLKERSPQRSAEEAQNEFQQWLSEHLLTSSGRRWLFDGRDPRLDVEPPAPTGYDDKVWYWSVAATYIDQKLLTDDGLIVFWGDWTAGHEDFIETVSIRSALASRNGAEALVAALQTAPELGRFVLPDEDDREQLELGPLKLTSWVSDRSISARLDEGDPWSRGLQYPGPTPSHDATARLGLNSSADGRTWTAGPDCLLRRETWTHIQGYGREAETVAGSRLSATRGFLKRLLESYPSDRPVLSVSVRRRRSGRRSGDPETYRSLYVRYYLMGADGVAHSL